MIVTLREEGLLDNRIVMFTGEHVLWTHMFYERSTNIPMILMGRRGDDRVGVGLVDIRLVSLQDIMPTRLHLVGIESAYRLGYSRNSS